MEPSESALTDYIPEAVRNCLAWGANGTVLLTTGGVFTRETESLRWLRPGIGRNPSGSTRTPMDGVSELRKRGHGRKRQTGAMCVGSVRCEINADEGGSRKPHRTERLWEK